MTDPIRSVGGFQRPRAVADIAQCYFYHAMDLPGVGSISGIWDLRGRFADYTGHVDMAGRSVLDVGTASGFLSFAAEAAGARVTSLDTIDGATYEFIPHGAVRGDPGAFARVYAERVERLKNAYWFAHARLGSRCRAYYANVYDLTDDVGSYDVVLIGQVLVHLRNPLLALERIATRCARTLVITEGMTDDGEPTATFLGNRAHPEQVRAWWHFSVQFYVRYLGILGFDLVTKGRARYPCDAPGHAPEIELTTLVFRRC